MGTLHVYTKAVNDVKMVLFMEQFGIEVTSSRFCAVYNLGMKLLQANLRTIKKRSTFPAIIDSIDKPSSPHDTTFRP